jgi:hypothetical protein
MAAGSMCISPPGSAALGLLHSTSTSTSHGTYTSVTINTTHPVKSQPAQRLGTCMPVCTLGQTRECQSTKLRWPLAQCVCDHQAAHRLGTCTAPAQAAAHTRGRDRSQPNKSSEAATYWPTKSAKAPRSQHIRATASTGLQDQHHLPTSILPHPFHEPR